MIDHVRHAITLDVRRQIEDISERAQFAQINMQWVCRFIGVAVKHVAAFDQEAGLQIPRCRFELKDQGG